MDLQSQIDLYIKNIFNFLALEEELPQQTIELVRNNVLLKSFEVVVEEKYDGDQKKMIEDIIESQNQEELEALIKKDNLQEDIQKQIQIQFISILGELLTELNKDNYISDEKLEGLIIALQDPDKQTEIFPELK